MILFYYQTIFVRIKSTRLFACSCGISRSSRVCFDQFARAALERFPVEFKFASVRIRYEETARVAPAPPPDAHQVHFTHRQPFAPQATPKNFSGWRTPG